MMEAAGTLNVGVYLPDYTVPQLRISLVSDQFGEQKQTATTFTFIPSVNYTSFTTLTLNLLTTTIVAPPSNASKWQMGFNSAFKGLR